MCIYFLGVPVFLDKLFFFRYPTDTVLDYCIRINGAHLNSLTVLVSDRRVEIEKKVFALRLYDPFMKIHTYLSWVSNMAK